MRVLAPRTGPALCMLLLAIGALWRCCPATSHTSDDAAPRSYPGTLVDTNALAGDFMWEQEIVISYEAFTHTLRAVVQNTGAELDVVGLTPFGTRAFLLQQRGTAVSFTNFLDRDLPFEPRSILIDIHRVYFHRLTPPGDGNGVVHANRFEETVTETWRAGRLVERRFTRPGGPHGAIVITYVGGMLPPTPPELIHLDNGWYGYQLEITTLSAREL